MSINFDYVLTPLGLTKIINIVFGIISLGCISATFDQDEFRNQYFFGAILTCFLVSFIYFLVHLLSEEVAVNTVNKIIDIVYHFIGAILLIVGASLFLELTVTFNQKYCDSIPNTLDPNPNLCGGKYQTKVSAGAFGLINGVFYLAAVVFRSLEKNEEEYEQDYRK